MKISDKEVLRIANTTPWKDWPIELQDIVRDLILREPKVERLVAICIELESWFMRTGIRPTVDGFREALGDLYHYTGQNLIHALDEEDRKDIIGDDCE